MIPEPTLALHEPIREAPATMASQRSSIRERRFSVVLVALLVIGSALAVPFHLEAFTVQRSFIPAFAGTTGTADLLAAALLFGLFHLEGRREVLAAASAYLLNALLIAPYFLTFPGVVTETGFIGNEQSAAFLWLLWHLCFPLIITAGFLAKRDLRRDLQRSADMLRAVFAVAAFAFVATYVATVQQNVLPVLVHGHQFSVLYTVLTLAVSFVNAAAVVWLWWRVRPLSTMALWIVVALIAATLDTALNGVSPARYSLVWYIGKVETFVSAAVIVISLFAGWSAMYARSVSLAQRLSRMLVERDSLLQTLAREQHISTRLQEASLPQTLPALEPLLLDASYHPGSDEATIGGDWYDAFLLDDGRVGITIGDVMGSGLHAAVTMTKLRQAMQAAAMVDPDPLTMLDVADRTLRLHNRDGFATALAMIYDAQAQQVMYASAGHPGPLVRSADGEVVEERTFGGMLGIEIDQERVIGRIATPPGTMLVLYTDGIIEHSRDLLESQTLLKIALADERVLVMAKPARYLVDEVLGGQRATDDIAVLTLHFTSARPRRAIRTGLSLVSTSD